MTKIKNNHTLVVISMSHIQTSISKYITTEMSMGNCLFLGLWMGKEARKYLCFHIWHKTDTVKGLFSRQSWTSENTTLSLPPMTKSVGTGRQKNRNRGSE